MPTNKHPALRAEYEFVLKLISPDEAADGIMELNNEEEKIVMLMNAVKLLTPDEKALITLFYLEEKSMEEIGLIMKLTIANVKVRLHRTRKKLYLIMTREDGRIKGY